jgi:hypothetical protein
MFARLERARVPVGRQYYTPDLLIGLPAPVQKYLQTALTEGQPIVAALRIEQAGSMNMNSCGESWKPFTATQRVVTARPGFVWQAKIDMLPGVTADVVDAYVDGEGSLHAALFGLATLANLRGTRDMAEGEAMRFLAEAAWYPTALLPGRGVEWLSEDDSSAWAILKDGETSVRLLFRFDVTGLIGSVTAEARGRTVGSVTVPTSWQGRWSDYQRKSGMLIPMAGEVAWQLSEGWKTYWRGPIEAVSYDFEETGSQVETLSASTAL